MKRREALTALGAVSLGITSPSLLHGEVMGVPYSLKKGKIDTDILVIGGGTAGVIAAIQAGRAGARTVLIENGSMLGGTTTTGGVNFPGIFFAWGKQVISGIGWELVQDAVSLADGMLPDFSIPHGRQHWKHQVRVNPAVYALLAEEKCIQAGVHIRFYETPIQIRFHNNRWIVLTAGKGIEMEITCHQLIDCTGNAYAASIAGLSVIREAETQPGTLQFRIGGYDLKSLDLDRIAVNYRRATDSGELNPHEFMNVRSLLANAGDNVQHIAGADSTTSETHTFANLAGRTSLLKMVRFLRTQPGLKYLKIEDMCNETAVRETYRIDGEYKITYDDYTSGHVFDDAVSYSYYPIDLHDAYGVQPKQLEPGKVATVPLRALIPRNSKNFLVAGRCVSSDRLANSALRVQGSCMGMGQAAAAAAVIAFKQGKTPLDISLVDLGTLLKEHGAIVPASQKAV
ncbi:FAD dependent oxidoreductase [bacterium A37T11]|nr:FAD dependent oxidoreductase [bacterium A37T11]